MNVKDLSITELKAYLYDCSIELERVQHNINMLKQELQRKLEDNQEEDKKEG